MLRCAEVAKESRKAPLTFLGLMGYKSMNHFFIL